MAANARSRRMGARLFILFVSVLTVFDGKEAEWIKPKQHEDKGECKAHISHCRQGHECLYDQFEGKLH